MNHPGTLRHSKSHRAAVALGVRKMRRFEIGIPDGWYVTDVARLATLSGGTLVQSRNPNSLVVDVPMGKTLDVPHNAKVKALGIVSVRHP